jgi:hypothetical protein
MSIESLEAASAPTTTIRKLARLVSYLVALFLIVFGARLWLIQHYGSSVPYWDQWDGEGDGLLKPLVEGRLNSTALFAPHNEHRIVCTRLLTIVIFALNRQWDPLVEMTVNAALCSLVAVIIAIAVFKFFPDWRRWPGILALVALFSAPFSYENTLSGFQSQFYFLTLFSLIAITGLVLNTPRHKSWWMGAIALPLACLSMASGFFAAVAVIGLQMLRYIRQPNRLHANTLVTFVFCLLAVGFGWLTKTSVPGHIPLKAESVVAWLRAFARCLAWPWYHFPALAFVLQLPLALLLSAYFYRKWGAWQKTSSRCAELLITVGLWCLIQSAAIAYARGGHDMLPAPRYMDVLAIGTAVNFFSVLLLWSQKCSPRSRILSAIFTIGWVCLVAAGLGNLTQNDYSMWLPAYRQELLVMERNVRGYVRSNDAETYLERKLQRELPYPNEQRLRSLLDDPTIRGILPWTVRPRVHLIPAAENSSVFVPRGYPATAAPPSYERVWGSYDLSTGGAQLGSWRGQLLKPATLPYLEVDVLGYLGERDLTLQFCNELSRQRMYLRPSRLARNKWQANIVNVPRGSGKRLTVLATDQNQTRWFAFTEPVEVGRLSFLTRHLLNWSGWILATGGVILLSATLYQAALWMRKALH